MPATAVTNPTRQRARRADARREQMGVSKAEIARRIGKVTPSDHAYVGQVLLGQVTSEPMTEQIEEALDAIAAEQVTP